jgi:hypothetical protein
VVPVPAAQGAWSIVRIAATGAQARISLTRGGTTLEAAMTADELLEAGLHAGGAVEVMFTGGTIFGPDGAGPVRLNTQALAHKLKAG